MSIENEVKSAMDAAIDHVRKELKTLRTGRANPSILDSVSVEVYGTNMRIKEMANVTTPESRQILITPYDRNNVTSIATAITKANLNITPLAEGNFIRINIPPMDEAIRKDIAKQCKKKAEDGKIAIREIRRKYNDLAKKQKSSSEITEDEMKRLEKIVQDSTDKFCKIIDDISKEKEKEIMEI